MRDSLQDMYLGLYAAPPTSGASLSAIIEFTGWGTCLCVLEVHLLRLIHLARRDDACAREGKQQWMGTGKRATLCSMHSCLRVDSNGYCYTLVA